MKTRGPRFKKTVALLLGSFFLATLLFPLLITQNAHAAETRTISWVHKKLIVVTVDFADEANSGREQTYYRDNDGNGVFEVDSCSRPNDAKAAIRDISADKKKARLVNASVNGLGCGNKNNNVDLKAEANATKNPEGSESSDIDRDGVADATDPDKDGDGIPNATDPDADGDNILDVNDPDLGNPGGAAANEENGAPEKSCESEGSNIAINWIICGFIRLLDGIINFFDKQIQALLVIPEDMYRNPELREAWGAFRNLALFILVPMMLVMVIGTAIGAGPFDPYTVKKALPRMLFAAIYIVLSWEITGFLVWVANTIGSGTLGLVTAPVDGADKITLVDIMSPGENAEFIFAGAVGGFAATWGLGGGVVGVLGSLALVAFIGLAIGWAVLMLRQILVIALILAAPLAILSWIFPGNDKLWKIWRESFEKLLIVFPIIMAMIGIGRVFAHIINETGVGFGPIETVLKLVAYIAPYFFIKSAFALGGSAFGLLSGKINDRSRGFFDKQRKKRAEKTAVAWQRNGGNKILTARGSAYNKLKGVESRSGRVGKLAARMASGAVSGYDLNARLSAQQAAASKEANDTIASGDDSERRGLSVNKNAALSHGRQTRQVERGGKKVWEHLDDDGNWANGTGDALMRTSANGTREFKTLGGGWVNEASVDRAQSRWGKDIFAQQASVAYEMRKAMESGDYDGVNERWAGLAKDQWGMSDAQAGSAWIGASFENQNKDFSFKNTDHSYAKDANGNYRAGTVNAEKISKEAYNNKSSYQLSQGSAHHISQLEEAYIQAEQDQDTESMERLREVAKTFTQRQAAGDFRDEDGNPIASNMGSAAFGAAVNSFAQRTGALPPGGQVGGPTRPTANPTGGAGPNNPTQGGGPAAQPPTNAPVNPTGGAGPANPNQGPGDDWS